MKSLIDRLHLYIMNIVSAINKYFAIKIDKEYTERMAKVDKKAIYEYMNNNNYRIVTDGKAYRIQKLIEGENIWKNLCISACGRVPLPHDFVAEFRKLDHAIYEMSSIMKRNNNVDNRWKIVETQ